MISTCLFFSLPTLHSKQQPGSSLSQCIAGALAENCPHHPCPATPASIHSPPVGHYSLRPTGHKLLSLRSLPSPSPPLDESNRCLFTRLSLVHLVQLMPAFRSGVEGAASLPSLGPCFVQLPHRVDAENVIRMLPNLRSDAASDPTSRAYSPIHNKPIKEPNS